MSAHELKAWPEYFRAVWTNAKLFEVRKNDRGYAVGDVLMLREFDPNGIGAGRDPSAGAYTGRELTAHVDYVLKGGRFGLERGYVVMSLKIMQRSTTSTRVRRVDP